MQFEQLCGFGAELTDDEDPHDAEPGHDAEQTLGWPERRAQPQAMESGSDDGEPSLGSTGMVDERRWREGAKRDEDYD